MRAKSGFFKNNEMKHHFRKHQGGSRRRSEKKKETIVEGVIQHHGRFAFLLSEEKGGSDIFLSGHGLNLAMDGDRVSARVSCKADGRFSGEIVQVLKRRHTSIVGILKKSPHGWFIFNEKRDAPPTEVIGFLNEIIPIDGALAVLELTRCPKENLCAAGMVKEILGEPDDMNARITMLLRSHSINENFPKEVFFQSEAFGKKLEPSQWHGREELFHLPIVTIDGADAKDFDDAVSLEFFNENMVRLGVHIADVSHYVKADTALDKEAYTRGTSVYLPGRVIPMLPPSLSNNLCSLVPLQERLTVSVFMDINSEGKVLKRRMANTVIRSCRRFTYEEVQVLLEGGHVPAVLDTVAEAIMRMGNLADALYNRRIKRGALDFDLPEYKVETDTHGKPLRVSLRPRLKSHRLIEEFMLLANEAIATELMAAKMPFLHRRHDDPDPVKMKTLAKALGDLGLSAGHLIGGGNTHKALQDILRQSESHPLSDIINSLMVRSMWQAVYSPESSGHFGIATKAYAHFTSPIRRYPDLMVHRTIKAFLCGEKENHGNLPLAKAGEHCSERERAAAEAEYKAIDIMRAELFKKQIGAEINGTVTSVIDSGSFVMCGDTGAEGLVRGISLKPGTKLKVIVEDVDTAEGKISLSLAQKSQIPTQWHVRPLSKKKSGKHRSK